MKFNLSAYVAAQRDAYETLSNPKKSMEIFKVTPGNITVPAVIKQELPFINTGNPFIFRFDDKAPDGFSTVGGVELNNRVLSRNNVFVIIAIRILFGIGANAAGRQYKSTNVTVPDGSVYAGKMSMKLESNTPVDDIDMIDFSEEGDFGQYSGVQMINPMRYMSGQLGKWQVIITTPDITTQVFTANVLRCDLIGVEGQA